MHHLQQRLRAWRMVLNSASRRTAAKQLATLRAHVRSCFKLNLRAAVSVRLQ